MDWSMAPFVPYNKKLRTRKSPSEMEEMQALLCKRAAKSRGAWHNDLHKLLRFPCEKGYCDFRCLGVATRMRPRQNCDGLLVSSAIVNF